MGKTMRDLVRLSSLLLPVLLVVELGAAPAGGAPDGTFRFESLNRRYPAPAIPEK